MDLVIKTKKVYVVSDIHNDVKGFKELLIRIQFTSNDILIIDGDIFDYGNNPIELYQEILKYKNIYVIQGNHDIWVQREIMEKYAGQQVGEYLSYNTVSLLAKRLKPVEMIDLANWVKQQPYYIKLNLNGKLYQISHAQTYPTPERLLDKSKLYLGDGHYDDFINGKEEIKNVISVVGHTSTDNRKIWTSESGRIIRIDCGNGFKCYNSQGRLGVIRLNDMKEYYI